MLRSLLALVLLAALPSQAPTWIKKSPTRSPVPYDRFSSMTYDANARKTVFYASVRRPETWLWDGKDWTLAATTGPAASQKWHRMVYDVRRKRVVMVHSSCNVYEWDGAKWTYVPTASKPRVTEAYGLTYDSKRGLVILFGGIWNGWTMSDTWEFDGKAWKQRSSGGPPHRIDGALSYDVSRDEVVIYGGRGIRNSNDAQYSDTWVWNDLYWREHFGIANPGWRLIPQLTYDPARKVTLLFGGSGLKTYNDTWEWDGTKWTQLRPLGSPNLYAFPQLAFDTHRNVAVLIGKDSRNNPETWEFSATGGVKATFQTFGSGCRGTAGVPKMAARAGSLPSLGKTFVLDFTTLPKSPFARVWGIVGASKTRWGTIPLPFDLKWIGMPGCTLYAAQDVPMTNLPVSNQAAAWSIPVPNNPTLAGGLFYVQGMVLDPGVNGFGAVMTNAGEGRLGH